MEFEKLVSNPDAASYWVILGYLLLLLRLRHLAVKMRAVILRLS